MNDNFDGVIIGSGHHGLILGTYLAKLGLRVAVLERRMMFGGGLSTIQPGPPGFYQNPHSINHFNITETPWYKDLGLASKVEYVTPRYDFAQPHADGTALVFSRDLEETVASIARFNKKDAATFREWNRRADAISDAVFLPERYSEPIPEAERTSLLSGSELGRDFLQIVNQQPLSLIDGLFEDERVKLLLLFKLSIFGTVLYDALSEKSPGGQALRGFDLKAGYQVAKGGSWNLARGLMETFIAAGGTYINHAEVSRIIVDGGRATGVELEDGRTIKAGQFVASTIDVPQTFNRLIGADQLPPEYAEKVANFKQTAWSLFGVHLALKDAPQYIGADFDPNINHALKYNVGASSVEELFKLHEQVARGEVPNPMSFGTGHITQYDPSQAPKGNHTAYAWLAMPYAPNGDPANIESLQDEVTANVMDKWREYAPNLTPDNVQHTYVHHAHFYSQDITNMVDGDIFMGSFGGNQALYNHFGYRTPIENLYMAGSPTHPGGAISGGAGYIVSKIIAEDLGLTPWWTPVDARASIADIPRG